jgi:hypothetical protein
LLFAVSIIRTSWLWNNDEAAWRGNATVAGPDTPCSIVNCTELHSGAPVANGEGGATLTARVAGFDVAVIQCSAGW